MVKTWNNGDGWHAYLFVAGRLVHWTDRPHITEGAAKAAVTFPRLPAAVAERQPRPWWQFWKKDTDHAL